MTFVSEGSSDNSLEQLAAHVIVLQVHHLFKDPAEVQWEPTEGEDEDEAEDSFGHLPPLVEKSNGIMEGQRLKPCNGHC